MPIPDERSRVHYRDIRHDEWSLGTLVSQLTGERIPAEQGAHLDPDLCPGSLPRQSGWRPVFGQSGAALAHLNNNGVTEGDLFIFFGLFRSVVEDSGVYHWDKRAKPVHLIWGWLQIEARLPIVDATAEEFNWAHYHPHFQRPEEKNNLLFLARENLALEGALSDLPGAGVFTHYCKERQLTAQDGRSVSQWALPCWCYPRRNHFPLTYHHNSARWQRQKQRTLLQSVARGQEFVLDTKKYPQALQWVRDIICG